MFINFELVLLLFTILFHGIDDSAYNTTNVSYNAINEDIAYTVKPDKNDEGKEYTLPEQEEPEATNTAVSYNIYSDDANYPNFLGRLVIPTKAIDVALYYEDSSTEQMQIVTDRFDSACYFCGSLSTGSGFIADHSNQSFSSLVNIVVGETGQIITPDGTILTITCIDVFDGHNTPDVLWNCIKDLNYVPVWDNQSIFMYTCINGWQNIRVTKWTVL